MICTSKLPRAAEAVVDVVAFVEMRVVDETLPADGGARLFKIDPHHDLEVGGVLLAGGLELAGIFERGFGVVDRARADRPPAAGRRGP